MGDDGWGFGVWAHNAECAVDKIGDGHFIVDAGSGRVVRSVESFDDVAMHLADSGDTLFPRVSQANGESHSASNFAAYKKTLANEQRLNPVDDLRGDVTLKAMPGATAEQIAQIRSYAAVSNLAILEGYISPVGRVGTGRGAGSLRAAANRAAELEYLRAASAGYVYRGHVGHGPDSTWTGRPSTPLWLDLDPSVNTSLGGQVSQYPKGYRPTRFIFEGDLP